MMTEVRHLIIFAKYPRPGETKTRLIPALGAGGAAKLHRELVERAVDTAREMEQDPGLRLTVCFDGATSEEMSDWLGSDLEYVAQWGQDIGERMLNVFVGAADAGASVTVLVGTDIPGLTVDHIEQAFEALKDHELVLGPAHDGGYYLVGMARVVPEVFEGIEWSTSTVLAETLNVAGRLGLTVKELERLDDIDCPEDLAAWRREEAGRG